MLYKLPGGSCRARAVKLWLFSIKIIRKPNTHQLQELRCRPLCRIYVLSIIIVYHIKI